MLCCFNQILISHWPKIIAVSAFFIWHDGYDEDGRVKF